jgi:hypothetical protein
MPTPVTGNAVLPFRVAMEARDHAAVVDSFALDAVLYSPLTTRLAFTGRGQIATLIEVVLEAFPDLGYTDEVLTNGTAVLVWRSVISGQDIEGVDVLRLRPDGKIGEFTAFFRPLPAAAAALRAIGTGLARRKSPAKAAAMSALTQPLAILARVGDPVGVRLVRSVL